MDFWIDIGSHLGCDCSCQRSADTLPARVCSQRKPHKHPYPHWRGKSHIVFRFLVTLSAILCAWFRLSSLFCVWSIKELFWFPICWRFLLVEYMETLVAKSSIRSALPLTSWSWAVDWQSSDFCFTSTQTWLRLLGASLKSCGWYLEWSFWYQSALTFYFGLVRNAWHQKKTVLTNLKVHFRKLLVWFNCWKWVLLRSDQGNVQAFVFLQWWNSHWHFTRKNDLFASSGTSSCPNHNWVWNLPKTYGW